MFAGAMGNAFAQLNMTLTDQIDYSQEVSNIWGYIDPEDSTEYAAVGTSTGVSVVDITDPYNVVETAFLPDLTSSWREVKSFGHYIYSVTEAGGGVQVINMTDPTNVTFTHWAPNIPGLGTLSSIHSVTVDEFGFLYLNGSNLNSGGVIVADVSADDGMPVYAGKLPAIYCHDSYARNNILYTSDIYDGEFKVYDVSDKSNPQLLANQPTPFNFTHNTWLSDDGNTIFTTDEKANAPVGVYDITDLNNIIELDQFRPISTIGLGTIPHNVHVWNDWVVTSYYTNGTIIIDGSRPENMIEVGYFDSFVSNTAGFFGVWGVYPYFPSGLVIASDIQNGLLVYDVNYVRACWLEGTVKDVVTGLPIQGATAHIASTQANDATTGLDGMYKTGQAIPGNFEVTFMANGYQSKTVNATLENGVLTILNVQLTPLLSYTFSGQTVKAADGTPIAGAQVVLQNDQTKYTTVADANGNFGFPAVFGGDYKLYAGAWGYITQEIDVNIGSGTIPPVIELQGGYYDDFVFDFNWTKDGTASTGDWELGEPVGTTNANAQSNPDLDLPDDFGDQCYVTGNGGGAAGDNDVDGGIVTLTSPVMDLTTYNKPTLKYTTWFYNGGGSGTPNDNLTVTINNGTEEVTLETIIQSGSLWRPESEFNLIDLIPITNTMTVSFTAIDQNPGHLVEAAVDAFKVDDTSPYPIFTASATSGCLPQTIQFFDASDTTFLWNWTFEGGTPSTSTEHNPTVVYNTPGTFNVTLTVTTQSAFTYTVERPNYITIGQGPTAAFTNNVVANVVDFSNTSANATSYSWTFGDGMTSASPNPSHAYSAIGQYQVTLTATNSCGSTTFTQTVNILVVPPMATFTLSSNSGCAPLTVQYTSAPVGDPTSYNWSFPGGTPNTSTNPNPTVVYNTPGTYSAQLTVSNSAGSNTATLNQAITVGAAPSALFSFGVTQYNASFTNNSSGATSYAWTFGDGSTSTQANPSHTYAANGEYIVTLEATNECGSAVITQTVNINVSGVEFLNETGYSLKASPNPFSQDLKLDYELADGNSTANLLIVNILGEQLGQMSLTDTNGSVNIGDRIPYSGVYFLHLQVDGKVSRALRVVKI